MSDQINKAFEDYMTVNYCVIPGVPRTARNDAHRLQLERAFKAGAEAGAEAKAQSMTATELSERVHLRERADYAAAIKAERERVLKEVRQFILRQSLGPDWQNNREYELLCEVKRTLLEAIK